MLKSAIEKIQEITKPIIHELNGHTYSIPIDGTPMEIRPELDIPESLGLTSLDALVKLIRTEAIDRIATPIYITIPTHLRVRCFTQPIHELREFRPVMFEVVATDVPGWDERVELGFEAAQIAMRTRFQNSADSEYALRLLSEISNGAKITYSDNGIATTVVTQKGVSLQSNEAIRPIISLRPYRTFQEIAQPESQFLIRVSERAIVFTEADGGMWKLAARQTIKRFLDETLEPEINAGRVVVAL